MVVIKNTLGRSLSKLTNEGITLGNDSFKKKSFKNDYACASKVDDSEIVLLRSYQTKNFTVAVKEHFLDLAFCCLEE